MKKVSLFTLWVLAFFLIAAPIYMEFHNVLLNGKPFARAALLNGQWAVPLDDFSRAIGGNGITLEPTLKLNGNQLSTNIASEEHKIKTEVKVEANAAGGSAKTPSVSEAKIHNPGLITIRKAGGISNNVFAVNGQKFVPLADIARAFGGTFTAPAGTLKPTESLSLNFTNANPNAVLGYQSGGH